MIEKAENQQTLADFLLLAQNVEKELGSALQSIDMVQDEKKPLLKTYLKREPGTIHILRQHKFGHFF